MAKGLDTVRIGVGAAKALGWTQTRMLGVAATISKAASSLDERVLGRVADGRTNPQARTWQRILPISAEVLGLSRESIAREMYWRDTYERLSAEIANGSTPIALEGFLLHITEIRNADDAAGAWNYAMAPYMSSDLQWDAVASEAFGGLFGRSNKEIRQSCVGLFRLAYDRFSTYAAKVRSGAFGLEAGPARLMAARADSMKAVAAEQLFSLALLNEQHDWKLTIDEKGAALSVLQTAKLLPTEDEVTRFSSILHGFLPGDGWIRRIENNKAVLCLAIASAAAQTDPAEAASNAGLRKTCKEAIATLRLPCDGERVVVTALPTYQSLAAKGLIDRSTKPVSGGHGPRGRLTLTLLAGLFFAGSQPALEPFAESGRTMASQIELQSSVRRSILRLAGPGGTRPTAIAAIIGPGGTVATRLTI